ncbi:MAG: hypothetical protein P1U61_02640 [Legionellaceae bacterium]|nr:hypothetical protein [Legionellaceae bacterium]
MLLYDAFIALQLQTPHALLPGHLIEHFSKVNVNQQHLNSAMSNKLSAYRRFFFDAPKSSIPILQNAYHLFLTQCEHELKQKEDIHLLDAILHFLENNHHINQLLQLLAFDSKTEAESLRIVPLAIHFIDNPKGFASFLGWLMTHHVSPQALLATHIIQDYFRYHLFDLDTPNSPIKALHACLSSEPETLELAHTLSETRCPKGELSSYGLDGHIHDAKTLNNPERTVSKLDTPITEKQFNALKRIFGIHFLRLTLANPTHHTPFLSQALNNDCNDLMYLPQLLHYIQSDELQKRALAEHLSDETLDTLIGAQVGGILILLPYAPYLRQKIGETDLGVYLSAIQKSTQSRFDLVSHLSELLKLFKHQNKTSALLVFDSLLDEILKEPGLLEDEYLLRQLQKFHPGSTCVSQRQTQLEATFYIHLQAQTNADTLDYIDIEDTWRHIYGKINAMQIIHYIPSSFPEDKHALHSCLAKARFKKHLFHLDTFIHALNIEPTFHPTNIGPYERLLINLLVSIDDNTLRLEITQRLNHHAQNQAERTPTNNWRTNTYGNSSLIKLACQKGNLGLVQWLKAEKIKYPESIEVLTITAAQSHHWALVHYFHQAYPLKQTLVDELLHLAVQQKNTQAITTLWENNRRTPRLQAIEKAFTHAVLQGDLYCTQALLHCTPKPCGTILTKGFKQAIQTGQFILATHIAEAHAEPTLKAAVNQMVLDVARTNKPGIIHSLGHLSQNGITQNTLDTALVRAVRARNIQATQALCRLPQLIPRAEAKKQALQEAQKTGQQTLIDFLAHATTLPTRRKHAKKQATTEKKEPSSLLGSRTQSCHTFLSDKKKKSRSTSTPLHFFGLSKGCLNPEPSSPSKRPSPYKRQGST